MSRNQQGTVGCNAEFHTALPSLLPPRLWQLEASAHWRETTGQLLDFSSSTTEASLLNIEPHYENAWFIEVSVKFMSSGTKEQRRASWNTAVFFFSRSTIHFVPDLKKLEETHNGNNSLSIWRFSVLLCILHTAKKGSALSRWILYIVFHEERNFMGLCPWTWAGRNGRSNVETRSSNRFQNADSLILLTWVVSFRLGPSDTPVSKLFEALMREKFLVEKLQTTVRFYTLLTFTAAWKGTQPPPAQQSDSSKLGQGWKGRNHPAVED